MIDITLEIKSLINQIVKNYQPNKIILFGSCANGTNKEGSDIDLLGILAGILCISMGR